MRSFKEQISKKNIVRMSSLSIPLWTPSKIPTTTTLSSIATTYAPALSESLVAAVSSLSTATQNYDFYSLSQVIRGAQASLTIIEAEKVLATATVKQVQARATQAIFDATLNLKALADDENLYGTHLDRPANIIYLVVFTGIFFYIMGMLVKSRYHWYNITFFCGYGLEFAGFLGRVLSFKDNTDMNYFLLQFVSLTIAPAFIMAGIYFLFAQCVVIHGRQFSVLKPMWYSYFFIGCDVLSLVIQAGGGAAASIATNNHEDTKPGTHTMIAGIVFQVVAMTVFLTFWFEFLRRLYFRKLDVEGLPSDYRDHPLGKPSVGNFFKFLFHVKSVREYLSVYREPVYNPKFESIRSRKLMPYMPLGITIGVVAVYIRCIYRVVELAQGFSGYLITHEVYLMTLDALMIAICGLIFIPLHPFWVFGSQVLISVKVIKANKDEEHFGNEDDSSEREKLSEDDQNTAQNTDEKLRVDGNTNANHERGTVSQSGESGSTTPY